MLRIHDTRPLFPPSKPRKSRLKIDKLREEKKIRYFLAYERFLVLDEMLKLLNGLSCAERKLARFVEIGFDLSDELIPWWGELS